MHKRKARKEGCIDVYETKLKEADNFEEPLTPTKFIEFFFFLIVSTNTNKQPFPEKPYTNLRYQILH